MPQHEKGTMSICLFLEGENDQLIIPAIPGLKIMDAHFLHGEAVSVMQDEQHSILRLPEKLPDEDCSVLVLKMSGNVDQVPVLDK